MRCQEDDAAMTKLSEARSSGVADAEAVYDPGVVAVMRLRHWQHLLNEMLKQKQFKIPIHLAFGHEAAAVAMDQTMAPVDRLCLTHRNAAYNLARARSLDVVLEHYRLAERSTGGLMGSMNLAVEDTSIAYSSSILGNDLAVATGIAMHRALVKQAGVVFVCTGDGAMEEGVFWESLLFSRSHNLGLVIVVENNDYSMSSTIAQRRSTVDLSQVCAGVGYQYFKASGAVLTEAKVALGSARASAAEGAPALVELDVSTFCQHAGPTPGWPDDPLRIAIEDGFLVEDSPNDPVFHIKQALGDDEFQRLSNLVVTAGAGE
jgi:TPP-dependent pyruvate/acetoin dehydrogenase alpha subunit